MPFRFPSGEQLEQPPLSPGMLQNIQTMEQIKQSMPRLPGQPDPYQSYARTIQNQQRRLQAVGVQPPESPAAGPGNMLETVFNVLDYPGRLVREQVLPHVGLGGAQDVVEEGGLKGFLTALATDPLTWATLGISGLAKQGALKGTQIAAKQVPKLALRLGTPFLTRTAEVGIPGTAGLAKKWLQGTRALKASKYVAPALRSVGRLFHRAPKPPEAVRDESIRAFNVMLEQPHELDRAIRAAGDDVAKAASRQIKSYDYPEGVRMLGMILGDDPDAGAALVDGGAEWLPRAVQSTQQWVQTIEDTATRLGLKPAQAAYAGYNVLPKVSRLANIMQESTDAAGAARRALQGEADRLILEIKMEMERLFGDMADEMQPKIAAFLRQLINRDIRQPLQELAPLESQYIGQMRMALALASKGEEGATRTLLNDLGSWAATHVADGNLEAVEEGLGEARRIADEFGKMAKEWQLREQQFGIEYDPLLDYVYHLYEDHPKKVMRIMEKVREQYMLRAARLKQAGKLPAGGYFTKQRTMQTFLDGVAHGLTPRWDPPRVAAVRELQSSYRIAVQKMQNAVRWLATGEGEAPEGVLESLRGQPLEFGAVAKVVESAAEVPDGWRAASKHMPGLGDVVLHPDVAHAIDTVRDQLLNPETHSKLFSLAAWYNKYFKPAVLTRPGYYLRNFLGEAANMIIAGTPLQRIPGLLARSSRMLAANVENLDEAARPWAAHATDFIVNSPRYGKMTAAEIREHMRTQVLYGFSMRAEISERAAHRIVDDILMEAHDQHPGVVEALIKGRLPDAKPFKKARDAAEAIESVWKGASFIEGLEQGMTIQEAASRTRFYHFDYADVSKFEGHLRASYVPFYVWTRKELPVLLDAIFTRPEVYLALGYAHDAGLRSMSLDREEVPEWLRASFALPTEKLLEAAGNIIPGMPAPEELLGALSAPLDLSFPVPGIFVDHVNRTDEDGQPVKGSFIFMDVPVKDEKEDTVYFTSFGLPTDLLGEIGPPTLQGVKQTMLQALAMVNPIYAEPLQLATGRRFFSGAPYPSREYQLGPISQELGLNIPTEVEQSALNLLPTPFLNVGSPAVAGQMAGELARATGREAEPIEPETIPPRPEEGLGRLALRLGSLSTLATPVSPERQRVITEMMHSRRLQALIQQLQRQRGMAVPTINQLNRWSPNPLLTLTERLRNIQPINSQR